MAQSVWLIVRTAREALANDRPDEAHRLIDPLLAEGYRKAWKVAREVVRVYVARANRQLSGEPPDPAAAWATLISAESLNTGEKILTALRLTLTRFGLVQARGALEVGDPVAAIKAAATLRDRAVAHPDLSQIELVGRGWLEAAAQADRGNFRQALSALADIAPKLPCPPTGFDRFKAAVEERHTAFRTAVDRLHDAAESRRWREVLAAADEVLAAAPEHRETRELQSKAWVAVEPKTADYAPPADSVAPFAARPSRRSALPPPAAPPFPEPPVSGGPPLPRRFLLWVDGIAMGGFLVCLGDRVTFGQGTQGGTMDVPLYADMSRFQAEIARDDEGYVVESSRPVRVNEREVTRALLADGDRVTLGTNFQFVFRTPVSLSSTAWLELTSAPRLMNGAESVLLMGNSLVLGPDGAAAHVVIPKLCGEVMVYRSRDGLGVRHKEGRFTIENRPCADQGSLPIPSVVDGDTFRFSLEAVGSRL